jgi:hypothetical protein
MKKLFMLIGVVGLACASQAASLDWKYSATADDVGQTVYVMLGTEAVQEWENVTAVQNAAVDKGTVAKAGRVYLTSGSATSDKITKASASVYYVVVSADGNSFGVTSVSDMTASVYDPAAQESSAGANDSLSSGSITKNGIAWGTGGDPGPGPDDPPGPGPDDPPGPGPDNPPTPGPGDDGGVPEPTSGILLMIGGAALALRRR